MSYTEELLKNGTSRRDFIKAAVTAPLLSATTFAEAADKNAGPITPTNSKGALPHRNKAAEEIEFPRVYTAGRLARISCPLGGIGTGGIGLGGRGNLQDWQIFNRPEIGNALEYSFPSLWVRASDGPPYSVVLERRLLPPYDLHQGGLGAANVPGLPRLAEARFYGSFPISRIEFEDRECPVEVSLEAFSPFQPLDADDSGLPCAVLSYEIRNPNKTDAEAVVAWSISNPVGSSPSRKNDHRTTAGPTGLFMNNPSLSADDPMYGSFVLAAFPPQEGSTEVLPAWGG